MQCHCAPLHVIIAQVIAQSFTFVMAGFETTALTLSLVTFMLATHPEVRDIANA